MTAKTPDTQGGAKVPQKKPIRLAKTDGRLPAVQKIGHSSAPWEDLYHWILTRTWPEFFGVVACAFVLINSAFALAYMAVPGAIANLPHGSFEDAFFFSVQTLATIGYGVMAPATRVGHLLVTLEALTGMLSVALMTGITFAKFARPTARVLFADKITITPRAGVPHLMFRVANWRGNQMIDAQLRVIVLVTETTPEGETMRIPNEVKLVRASTMLFTMTWLPMHKIDESSFFFGPDAIAKLREKKAEIYVSLTGYDETIGQTVHARKAYSLDDIVENARFADVLSILEDGTRVVNYHDFHETVPIEPAGKRE
ncbi:MAG: ATP-sensitive inward rectifier potassium channel 10 [Polyangiaceae bacterium]|nr:ATP-sensitive inward rectifier potassium channel 10 [Polyangiaceae bacterium]